MLPKHLLWWEHDAEPWGDLNRIVNPFFGVPSNEFLVATEDFSAALEQVWAIMEGEA